MFDIKKLKGLPFLKGEQSNTGLCAQPQFKQLWNTFIIFSVLLYLSNLRPSPLPLCCAASCPCSLGWTDVLFMAGGKQPPSMGGAQTAQPQQPRIAREEQTKAMLNRSLCLALQNEQVPPKAAPLARAQCLSTLRIKQHTTDTKHQCCAPQWTLHPGVNPFFNVRIMIFSMHIHFHWNLRWEKSSKSKCLKGVFSNPIHWILGKMSVRSSGASITA